MTYGTTTVMAAPPDCDATGSTVVREEGVERARRTYAVDDHPAAREFERRTLGSDFGANGYATLAEVDELPAILDLGPGRRLLDVGAGQGWPGVYLARTTGCAAVLTDVPFEGLAVAARRISRERLGASAWGLVARGDMVPLRPACFGRRPHRCPLLPAAQAGGGPTRLPAPHQLREPAAVGRVRQDRGTRSHRRVPHHGITQARRNRANGRRPHRRPRSPGVRRDACQTPARGGRHGRRAPAPLTLRGPTRRRPWLAS